MNKTINVLSKNFKKYNPSFLEDYIKIGGLETFKACLKRDKDDIIEDIKKSGIRGRGGAAYPTGKKLEQSAEVQGDRKVIICNADEGEPGTFKDRQFLEFDPMIVIEGMMITAYATNATEGYLYVREEYSHLHDIARDLLKQLKEAGYLGKNILGTDFSLNLSLFSGAGAYVCGEGGALIESIEGKVGYPRSKPPYTKQCGLYQLPTLVINVETLAAITASLDYGIENYAKLGTKKSPGTKIISVSGKVNKPAAFEIEFGITFNEVIDDLCGGMKDGAEPYFLQIGGASGPIIPAKYFNLAICYDELWEYGFDVGSGAIVVVDRSTKLTEYLEAVYHFFNHESCGKCTPCREGNMQIAHCMSRFTANEGTLYELIQIEKYANNMKECSFCGLGKTSPTPFLTGLKHYRTAFEEEALK